MKKIIGLVLVFALFLTVPSVALEPIPEGTNLVLSLNNFSRLPISQLFQQNPFIPNKFRSGLENFIKASGFNIFSDISSIQVFVALEGKQAVGAGFINGKFDIEKLSAWVKLILGENLETIPCAGQSILTDKKDKKVGGCFIDNSTILLGCVPFMQKVLECRQSKNGSAAFSEALSKCNEKAYITLVFVGKEQAADFFSHAQRKIAKRPHRRKPEAFLQKMFFDDILEGLSFNYIMTQRLDDRAELWVNYDRSDKKNVGIHLLLETDDQTLFVSNFLKILADKLAKAFTEPQSKERPENETNEGQD